MNHTANQKKPFNKMSMTKKREIASLLDDVIAQTKIMREATKNTGTKSQKSVLLELDTTILETKHKLNYNP